MVFGTIGQKVEWLFKNIPKANGEQYTNQEIEEGTERLGHKVSVPTIWKIRHDKTPNPGYLTLRALALFFRVEPAFFYKDKLSLEELTEIKRRSIYMSPQVSEIALCASKLDQKGRDLVLDILKYIQRKE